MTFFKTLMERIANCLLFDELLLCQGHFVANTKGQLDILVDVNVIKLSYIFKPN